MIPAIRLSSIEPGELPNLPLYDSFDIFLKGSVLPKRELSFRLIDLQIYTTQLRKILLSTLYYLEVL